MEEKTLNTLEFDKVLARLARHTSFSAGRELALSLRPSNDYDEVLRNQRLTAEARRLRETQPRAGLGGVHDVRQLANKANLGGVLEPSELLDVAGTLAAGQGPEGGRPASGRPAGKPPAAALRNRRTDHGAGGRGRRYLPLHHAARGSRRQRQPDPRRHPPRPAHRPRPALRQAPGAAGVDGYARRDPGADHHPPRRPLRHSREGRGPRPGSGHRARRLGERRDDLRRAAGDGRPRQQLARDAGRGAARGRAHSQATQRPHRTLRARHRRQHRIAGGDRPRFRQGRLRRRPERDGAALRRRVAGVAGARRRRRCIS